MEILVALGIFLVATLGVLGVLGATAGGGLQEAAPTALTTGRRARDLTAAAVYLQGLQDYLSSRDDAAWDATVSEWPPDAREQTYCIQPGETACPGADQLPPPTLGPYPLPPLLPFQLAWTALRITIQRRYWDCTLKQYTPAAREPTPDYLIVIHAAVEWRFKGTVRTLAQPAGGLERPRPARLPAWAPVAGCS